MLNKIKNYVKKHMVVKEVYADKVPVISGELLSGRVALITGASEGIGYGIAEAMVKQQAKVVITGRNEKKLINACSVLGENASYMVWDASNVKDIEKHLVEVVQKFGRIDILVNNAGYHGNQNFLTISEKDWDSTFDVNMKFVFFMSQAVAKYMIDNKVEGNILNIASSCSMKPAWSPYEISKWGVRGFTRGLARELAPYGILVNGIAPGPTATAMSHYKEGDNLAWNHPKGRMVLSEEIGNLAVYLCSDFGKCIMGEMVFCDGGSGLLTMNK